MRNALPVTPSLIKETVSEAEALATIHRSKPSVDDYISEGVLDSMPEEDAQGQIDVKVQGHDKVVRMLQMNEEFRRKESDYFDNLRDSKKKAAWRAQHAERKARKFHAPAIRTMVGYGLSGWQYRCDKGHTFAFLTSKPDAECRPCIRDGCDAKAYRERA